MKIITIFMLGMLCHANHPNALAKFKSRYQRHFLVKTPLTSNPNAYGQHIRIIQDPNDIELRIDDRDIIEGLKLNKDQKKMILSEYLTFENDTVRSDKYYYFRSENYKGQWRRPDVQNFTVEIEALFSFTKMLTKGVTPLYPLLIDKRNNKVVNGDRKAIQTIYNIYRKWLRRLGDNDFRKLKFPLTASRYQWLNENFMTKDSWVDAL